MPGARVALGQIGEIGDVPGQQTAAERRVGDKGDAEITRQLAGLSRLFPVEQRELALHSGDRVRRMGPPDPLRPCLAQSEKPHFALLDEPRHRADRLLDRHCRVDPVLVVEVDDLDPEPLQARLAGPGDIGGAAVDPVGAAGPACLTEFGGDHNAITAALQRAAEQLFVLPPAIHVRAVEMVDPEFDRAMDQPHSGRVVADAVDARQRHAAEADRRDLRSRFAELPALRDPHIAHRSLR